ncbi:MAG: DNA-3-methyladenine glycosylase [Firmicutes bacterium]|nr:DNA-3-methyladenine glycosylase [Bacillota bacterium]
MLYEYDRSACAVRLAEAPGFSVGQTLECGQCFRFARVSGAGGGAAEYVLAAYDKVLRVRQEDSGAVTFFPTTPEEFEAVWIGYFDLAADYENIKRVLTEKDEWVREASARFGGIRILNQEPWECLVSFILSQVSNIPRIKKVLGNLTRAFGTPISDGFHTFPSPARLAGAGLGELEACGTGFRAQYILDAAQKVASGELRLEALFALDAGGAREELMKIKGVGPKIADCVMLFSLGKKEVFPADVWIKRVMQRFYFGGAPESIKAIGDFAARRFGEYAGVAQEYLYAYARDRQIGKKNEA